MTRGGGDTDPYERPHEDDRGAGRKRWLMGGGGVVVVAVVAALAAAQLAPDEGGGDAGVLQAPVALTTDGFPVRVNDEAVRSLTPTAQRALARSLPVPDGAPADTDPTGGVPQIALQAYRTGEAAAAAEKPGCHLGWWVLAGLGKQASDHAGDGKVDASGVMTEPLRGPRLDGSMIDTRLVLDTDQGRLDGDGEYDRGMGPMQFLPGTWRLAGRDGDGDGIANPDDIQDAAVTAASYLCSAGDDLTTPEGLSRALLRLNTSQAALTEVLTWGSRYASVVTPPAATFTPRPDAGPVTVTTGPLPTVIATRGPGEAGRPGPITTATVPATPPATAPAAPAPNPPTADNPAPGAPGAPAPAPAPGAPGVPAPAPAPGGPAPAPAPEAPASAPAPPPAAPAPATTSQPVPPPPISTWPAPAPPTTSRPAPARPHEPERTRTRTQEPSQTRDHEQRREREDTRNRDRSRQRDDAGDRSRQREDTRNRDRSREGDDAGDRSRQREDTRSRDRSREGEDTRNRDRSRQRDDSRSRDRSREGDDSRSRDRSREGDDSRDRDRSRQREDSRDRDRSRQREDTRTREREDRRERDRTRGRDHDGDRRSERSRGAAPAATTLPALPDLPGGG